MGVGKVTGASFFGGDGANDAGNIGNGMAVGNAFAGSIKYFKMRAGTANALQGFTQYSAMALAVNGMGHALIGDQVVLALSMAMISAMVVIWAGLVAVSFIEHYKVNLRYF